MHPPLQSLVLDGRLVVDGAFRTNDAAIYAGGELVKLSRRAQDPRRCGRKGVGGGGAGARQGFRENRG